MSDVTTFDLNKRLELRPRVAIIEFVTFGKIVVAWQTLPLTVVEPSPSDTKLGGDGGNDAPTCTLLANVVVIEKLCFRACEERVSACRGRHGHLTGREVLANGDVESGDEFGLIAIETRPQAAVDVAGMEDNIVTLFTVCAVLSRGRGGVSIGTFEIGAIVTEASLSVKNVVLCAYRFTF